MTAWSNTINEEPHFGGPSVDKSRSHVIDFDSTPDEHLWSTFLHLSGLTTLISGPILPIAIPLIMWLIKRGDSPFVDDHGKEVINFQISLILWYFISGIMVFACGIGIFMAIMFCIISIIMPIIGAIRANRGEYYRYPMTFRFLS